MLAVEVFTGTPPFGQCTPTKAASNILAGDRPTMPGNAQAVGLTTEMWKLLENCWRKNHKRRPTMEEVVRRWQKFVEDDTDNNVPEDPLPGVSPEPGTSLPRAVTEASRPQVRPRDTRHRTASETPRNRWKPETLPLKPLSGFQPGTRFEAIQQGTRSRRGTESEVTQPQTQTSARQSSTGAVKPKRLWFCGLF